MAKKVIKPEGEPVITTDETAELQYAWSGKYKCLIKFAGQKQVWPKRNIHGVAAKKMRELSLADVDALVAAGAVKGIFELK